MKDSTRYWGAFKFTLVMLLFFTFIMAKQLKGAVSQRVASQRYTHLSCSRLFDQYTYEQVKDQALDGWEYYVNSGSDPNDKISGAVNCFCAREFREHGEEMRGQTYANEDHSQGLVMCDDWLQNHEKFAGAYQNVAVFFLIFKEIGSQISTKISPKWLKPTTQTR